MAQAPLVFISFKSEELASAIQLRDKLLALGLRVWWQQEVQCAQEWHGEIDRAVLEATCIVVLWSPAAIESPWIKHEASQAIARGVYAPVRIKPVNIPAPFPR